MSGKSVFNHFCLLAVSLISFAALQAQAVPLSPQAQAAYDSIIQLGREAMQSPQITRRDFEQRLSSLIKGTDDDPKAARGSAMVMYDTIELVHAVNSV